ncbi:uncharacterized protein LOC111380147, partial [Olea europaea var. sylvestris]|uniref:uncharacterized protein LOC111380147 n=1 Tax=Olea europaea var. sylvestris TaxID=158386 RepID=UPI000C1D6A17
MCQHFKYQGISDNAIRLRLFPHTLRDKALEWLDSLPIASITTWNELAHKFCTKFFLPAKIAKLRHEISIFSQGESESFDEAWNRFKNMLRKYPQHGFDKKTQIRFFYTGLLPHFKSMVDSSSDGSISTRTIDGALELFERMATTSAMWSSERVIQKKPSGIYEVDAYSAISAKIDSLFHKVESMSQTTQNKKISYEECGAEHKTSECPILMQGVEQTDFVQWGQRQQNNPHSETFNQGWRKHPNFSWNNQNQNKPQAIKNLETQMGQMAISMTEIHVKRPSVTVETSSSAKDETTVKESTPGKNSKKSQDKAKVTVNPYEPPIPFPQRLKKHKMEQQYKKFLEVFKKLHINIPLADALLQMPSYAKFLKDILSNKRKLEDHETVMLTEDINLMPLSIFKKLGLGEPKETTVTLQLADRSLTHPRGIIED